MNRLRILLLVVAGALVILHGLLPHHHADDLARRTEAGFHIDRCVGTDWGLADLFSNNHSVVSSPDRFLMSSGINIPISATLNGCGLVLNSTLLQVRIWTSYSPFGPHSSGEYLTLTTRPPPFA